uniref:G-protein coupled receptors family 1 profile domain-containing protein n=1 Tax=Timema tahoe TaxID=61484 RepID=A0A7R9FHQ2_9NEOP|nr:unnamed protein product [Timema tahoe]
MDGREDAVDVQMENVNVRVLLNADYAVLKAESESDFKNGLNRLNDVATDRVDIRINVSKTKVFSHIDRDVNKDIKLVLSGLPVTRLLNYNVIEEVESQAFDGSQVAKLTYRSRGASSYRCRLCLAQKDGKALLAPLCTLALILLHSKSVIWHEVVEHPQLVSVVYILRMIVHKDVSESFKGNRALTKIHPDAFVGLKSLRYLDLSETSITQLPTRGLQELDVLRLQDTATLKVFPSIYNFEYIREAWLTYPYHCCAFQFPSTHDPAEYARHQDFVELMEKQCSVITPPPPPPRVRRSPASHWEQSFSNETSRTGWGGLGSDVASPVLPMTAAEHDGTFHQEGVTLNPGTVHALCGNLSKNYRDVVCAPDPDAFNPCEDLMGNWGLRAAVWVVAVAALVGNLAVLLVLLSSRFRMTVPKFLMCNLALADLCMGAYLILIAVMDAKSIGTYFNYAIDWQSVLLVLFGECVNPQLGYRQMIGECDLNQMRIVAKSGRACAGCQVAGFLTVFASELSIFTLTVITSERWYTITYAIHLNKRLKLRTAGKIMAAGWLYAVAMAALPLLGVSGYSKTSICLPMDNSDNTDIAYLITLLSVNGLAFWIICACYGRMYCSIRGGQDAVATLARSDMTVAKRMALLVFTDFACWAPIAFFGLTALAGYPLIDVPHTKILLVFFYPLNSCANPYLYALLTQQYRRDLFILLSRYGLCSDRAALYKGPPGVAPRGCGGAGTGERGRVGGGLGAGCGGGPGHRGSLLTTLTSVDGNPTTGTRPSSLTAVPELGMHFDIHRRSTVEMLPLGDAFAEKQPPLTDKEQDKGSTFL